MDVLFFLRSRLHKKIFDRASTEFKAYIVTEDEHKHQAKLLHSTVYLDRGFISKEDIDTRGFIKAATDPHQHHSQYFIVCEQVKGHEHVRITGRQIHAKKGKGFDSFPILQQAHIYPHVRERIHAYDPARCVEISGLAKIRGTKVIATLLLYRIMWQYANARGDKLWLMACSPSLYARLKRLFGPAIIQIGQRTPYKGEDVVPAMLKVDQSIGMLRQAGNTWQPMRRLLYRAVLDFFMDTSSTGKGRVSGV